MRALIWVIVAALLTSLVCALVAAGDLPLGVAGQWQWGKLNSPSAAPAWLCAGIASLGYITLVVWGGRWIANGGWVTPLLLTALVCGGIATQTTMQLLGFGLGKWPFVLYSPATSGYYTAAKRDVQSARQFLADYHRVQEFYRQYYGPLHLATHPPGLVLLQYGLIRLCEENSTLTHVLLEHEPHQVAQGFRDAAAPNPLAAPDEAAMWLMAILSQLASGLTILPIYSLARRGGGPPGAWYASALWPLVPAVTMFMPKSDVLYPLFAATCVWFLVMGGTAVGRLLAGFASGITLWAGMFLSFGLVALAPLALLTAAFAEGMSYERIIRSVAQRTLGFVAAISFASILLWASTGHWLPETWWRCYRIHATFYDPGQIGAGRTYWPWVWFNLAEFAIAAGVPLIVAALTGTVFLVRALRREQGTEIDTLDHTICATSILTSVLGIVLAWWFILLLLDLTGKNLGEVARLWMFLIPFACVAAGRAMDRIESSSWRAILVALQAIQTATFAANVQGFFDPSSIGVG